MTKRIWMMVTGILFICICVGSFRLSGFGADAFTCMNLGISGYIGMAFGTWQLIANAFILVIVFFTFRRCIGAGTIINMVCVGYGADLICWLFQDVWHVQMTLPLRILALLAGCLCAGLGVALYMAADMGISPYDSVAPIIEKMARGKIPFQYARIAGDVTAILVGVAFCLIAGNDLWMIVGIGTVCNACLNGPLIQFFKTHVAEPILNKDRTSI